MRLDRATWLLASVSAVWGASYTVTGWGLRELDVVTYNAIRFAAAAPLLLLLVLVVEGRPAIGRRWWPRLALSAAIGIVAYQLTFSAAVALTTVTESSVLIALSPFWTALFARRAGEPVRGAVLIGATVAMVGVVLVVLGRDTNHSAPHRVLGDLSALAAAALWGSYPVITRPLLKDHSPLRVTAWASAIGAAVLLLTAITLSTLDDTTNAKETAAHSYRAARADPPYSSPMELDGVMQTVSSWPHSATTAETDPRIATSGPLVASNGAASGKGPVGQSNRAAATFSDPADTIALNAPDTATVVKERRIAAPSSGPQGAGHPAGQGELDAHDRANSDPPPRAGHVVARGAPLETTWAGLSGLTVISLVFSVLAVTVYGLVAWYWGVRRVGSAQTMVFMFAVPVAAAVFAVAVGAERITGLQVAGAGLVLAALAYSQRNPKVLDTGVRNDDHDERDHAGTRDAHHH
ncbi:DMT family transporter [Nocardia pneumoniae]|uniref:DMT family transporter n=1 Tax=Nocardia pneumoniae TaxID=228601 RepID=UPI0002D97F24|nr:DMT family transporter [Nocardia pneumoniae]